MNTDEKISISFAEVAEAVRRRLLRDAYIVAAGAPANTHARPGGMPPQGDPYPFGEADSVKKNPLLRIPDIRRFDLFGDLFVEASAQAGTLLSAWFAMTRRHDADAGMLVTFTPRRALRPARDTLADAIRLWFVHSLEALLHLPQGDPALATLSQLPRLAQTTDSLLTLLL